MKQLATENIEVFNDPFPHGVAHNFFTPESYSGLLAALPALNKYDEILGESGRSEFWLDKRFSRLLPEQKVFWARLYQSLAYTEISQLFTPFLSAINTVPVLAKTFNRKRPVPQLRLVCENDNYETLLPHLDQVEKVLVVVLYLPATDKAYEVKKGNGTTLYKKNEDEFILKKTVEFIPNTACITVRTPDAWHGGEWDLLNQQRRTLHIYYFL